MKVKNLLAELRTELQSLSDEKNRISGERFFKESVQLYGVPTAAVTRLGKQYLAGMRELDKQEIFTLCELLWQSGYMEESFIACNWAYAMKLQFGEEDFQVFERWLHQYVSNWAACDTLCNHTIAALIDRYPEMAGELLRWTESHNRWVKRGAAVTLIIPAREGRFHDIVFRIADVLLADTDDLVQKGYGWMLKAASQHNTDAVFAYVMKYKQQMPRTALRYAIEKMPEELRRKAMAK